MNLSRPDSSLLSKPLEASLAILPVAYLPPLDHFAAMLAHDEVKWDTHEFFHKQYYYNRCVIYGPNGEQKLTIPVHKKFEKTPIKDILIGYETPWQKIHWRSFEAAYRRSPYFEYYEGSFYPLYWEHTPKYLVEWNIKILEVILGLMKIELKPSYTNEYIKSYEGARDYRNLIIPNEKTNLKEMKYHQVFEERHGFIPNLSIIDLLFCEGPHAKEYLHS